MKKLLAVLSLALVFAGCSKPSETPGNTDTPKDVVYKAGSASVTEVSVKDVKDGKGRAQFDTTYAGVILDENDVIVYVSFDVVQNKLEVNGEGAFAQLAPSQTKKELKDAYGMVKASSIGKEMYEQLAALEEYLVGKNIQDVLNMELENNKSTDADLLAGCTVTINGYLAVLEKAYENAKEAKNVETAALGSVSSLSGKDVADGKGSAKAETEIVFYALDKDGKVVYLSIDTASNSASLDGEGKWSAPETTPTKKELGENYGMGKISSIGKEWNEQIAAFEEYALGKTIDEITGMEVDKGKATDADLLAGCTIGVSGYLSAVDYASNYEVTIK